MLLFACCPAKASEFSSAHVCGEQDHVALEPLRYIICELISNQCEVIQYPVHSRTAAQVLSSSWSFVFAVTVPRQCGRVDISQSTIHAKREDLPIPWPLAMAWRIGRAD